MEALKNLVANVPDWLKKLDELNGQIEQRQIELARLTAQNKGTSPDGVSIATKSVRNKGSTESLRPRNEPEAHPHDPIPQPDADNAAEAAAAAVAGAATAKASTEQPAPSSPSQSQSPSAVQRQAHARTTLRKRQRTNSVASTDGAAPKYRTRSIIIVYYDSYVQAFFEELVKFVSSSRNIMRKAKMTAKIAKIKRLAELDSPDQSGNDSLPGTFTGDGPIAADKNNEPALHYVSTRRAGPGVPARTTRNIYARAGARGGGASPTSLLSNVSPGAASPPDVYDELDKGLEYVQSMCEHAAHQFLRGGDCGEEVANIKGRLGETRELAEKEMARVRAEDPQALLKLADDDGIRPTDSFYLP